MKTFLRVVPALYAKISAHLFPPGGETEEAAFLCVSPRITPEATVFEVVDSYFAVPPDFTWRDSDYLELTDEARIRLIKQAHQHGASLVEMHSHMGPYAAAFSPSDRTGLRETVPHMRWRLKNKPYIALVFAARGFDALVWLENDKVPRPLDALLVDEKQLAPTNLSLRGWP
jgi:hypothetical protein